PAARVAGCLDDGGSSLARTPIVKATRYAGGWADLDDGTQVLRFSGMKAGAPAANWATGRRSVRPRLWHCRQPVVAAFRFLSLRGQRHRASSAPGYGRK